MSLFEKKYHLIGWDDKEHSFTAKQLYERIMEDCESDYNWIAPATELVRVCKNFDFPEEYAQKIQIAILNCFANLETRKEIGGRQKPTDAQAVNFCYNTLANTSDEADKVRAKYLKAVIEGITRYHFSCMEFTYHGPAYHKICEEWKRIKFEEYSPISFLDFEQVRKELNSEFDKMIKTAEAEGVFKKDEEERLERMRKFWSSLLLDMKLDN